MKKKMMMEESPAEEKEEMDSMQVDSACNTLLEAERIKADPALYKAALAKIGDKKKHAEAVLGKPKVTSIEGLKKAANEAED